MVRKPFRFLPRLVSCVYSQPLARRAKQVRDIDSLPKMVEVGAVLAEKNGPAHHAIEIVTVAREPEPRVR